MHAMMGLTVKDKISGWTGVVTGHCDYISGCDQLLVTPSGLKKDGTVPEGKWVDVQRLEVVSGKKRITLDNEKTPGPDLPAPIR
jgi:hypothetical protein